MEEYYKRCAGPCKQNLPLICYGQKTSIKGKIYPRSNCLVCERKNEREKRQKSLIKRYYEGDLKIAPCPYCHYYFSKFASGATAKERIGCKPCLKGFKLRKNKVFQDAKALLLQYAGEKVAVKRFLQDCSVGGFY